MQLLNLQLGAFFGLDPQCEFHPRTFSALASRRARRFSRGLAFIILSLVFGQSGGIALEGQTSLQMEENPRQKAGFREFIESIWPLAAKQNISRTLFDSTFDGMIPDLTLPRRMSSQAEFEKPLKDYLAAAVTNGRIGIANAAKEKWRNQLANIQQSFGVPQDILLAAWAMESDFGRVRGDKDVIRTLASLAFLRDVRTLFLDELIAALNILERGDIDRSLMKGSWAGAMGDPQFLPSTYLKYAVHYSGSGSPDIWTSPPDILASIANFLHSSGWTPGLVWGMEVIVPASFNYAKLHNDFSIWSDLGVATVDGRSLPARGNATLYMPSGANGPAFLLSDNYWILKKYNNSDSYALSLAWLAERIGGGGPIRGAWPVGEKSRGRSEKTEIQRLLTQLGFYNGTVDGRLGPASRDAIHDFQIAAKTGPADGYPAPDLLRRLRAAVAARN
jgi:lytic murein transglycosylase